MIIKTSDLNTIKPFIKKLTFPLSNSHKGQNGRILIIGGSSLFHAASIWAAEIASYFVDIVHYSSTKENNEIMLSLKKKFLNGIVVSQSQLDSYIKEDDVILAGPGMIRDGEEKSEAKYTYSLTKHLIFDFPEKRFVFDAGCLQMMKADWLLRLKTTPILTPHQIEFERLFKTEMINKSIEEKKSIVKQTANKYHCVILLKAVVDIISDGKQVICVQGGNQGLTKGGTGDVLAGLATSFYSKSSGLESAIFASYLLKRTSDELSKETKYWYNMGNIIEHIPIVMKNLVDCV